MKLKYRFRFVKPILTQIPTNPTHELAVALEEGWQGTPHVI
jgi:hypothetical protein